MGGGNIGIMGGGNRIMGGGNIGIMGGGNRDHGWR